VVSTQKPVPITPAGTSAGDSSSYVEVPQADGTVLKQKVVFDTPQETQNTATTATTTQEPSTTTTQKGAVTESIYANTDAYAVHRPVAYPDFFTGESLRDPVQTVHLGAGRFKPITAVGTGLNLGSRSGVSTGQAVRPRTDARTDARLDVFPDVRTDARTDVIPDVRTDTRERLATDSLFDFARPVPPVPRTPRPIPPEELIPRTPFPRPRGEGEKKGLFGSFSVQVRSKGKFKTVAEGLGLKEATSRGAGIVGTTTSASFRLVSDSKQNPLFSDVSSELRGRFRPSKRDPNIIVERRQFRISTSGEKTGLKKAKRRKGLFGSGMSGIFQ
ncbi:hypothetical protein DRQ25_17300, partial [Candidatus Fermentibacteria bacterium]